MDDNDGEMDALFSTFMNEVSSLKSTKMKKLEANAGTAEEIVERLTATPYDPKQGHGSAFTALGVSHDASESEITKQYRKLSVLIHPDKCKLPNASEAFQVLVKAYNDTKDPNYQDKYKDIIGKAKERVRKARAKENVDREKRGEDPLDMEGNEFDQEVIRECDRMLSASTEATSHANSVLEANMKRMAEQAKEGKMRKREEEQAQKKWAKQRDKRAAGWQTFMANMETKKFKSETFHKVGKVGAGDLFCKREERKETDKKAEIDFEDKKVLKSDLQFGATGIDKSYRDHWR